MSVIHFYSATLTAFSSLGFRPIIYPLQAKATVFHTMVQDPQRTAARMVRGLANVKLGVLVNCFPKGHAVQQCSAESLDADRSQKERDDEEKDYIFFSFLNLS
jgi:hypothetical protein